jgi:hypothetical protein
VCIDWYHHRIDVAGMRARDFRIGSAFVAVIMTTLLAATAQQLPVNTKAGQTGQLAGNRDKEKEDKVAKLVEDLRADAKIPPLERIRHRASLEQTVCTIALTDTPPKHASTTLFGFYKTANPDVVAPELSKVALLKDSRHKDNPVYTRYSVAVWPVSNPETGEQMYWVGVQLFWSAGIEFFDYHFTDDVFYHNEWKKAIAAPCRNK